MQFNLLSYLSIYISTAIFCLLVLIFFIFPIIKKAVNYIISKTRLFKYTENFTTRKFSDKNSDTFHISALNIDCGYLLEQPQGGSSNEYPQSMRKNNVYTCKSQFYYIKVGFKGVQNYTGMFL